MSTPTLDELYTPLTLEQVMASILDVAEQLELPIEAWQAEGVAREILTVIAQEMANLSVVVTPMAAGGLLDFSRGVWLTLLADQLYDVQRIPATSGTTVENLVNIGPTAYTIAPGDLRFYNTVNGANYTNTTGGTLGAKVGLVNGTLSVTIQADVPGIESNAAIGEIGGMSTPLQGVNATNPGPLVGTAEESDSSLIERCRESLAAASPNGPKDAYNYFAKSTTRADGSNVGVTRTAVSDANATIVVYLANASGVVAPSDVALVNTAIQTKCVPTGFTATVKAATGVTIAVTATVYLSPGSTLDNTQAGLKVRAQLLAYFATIPIGGSNIGGGGQVFKTKITGQILDASSEFIQGVISAPAADVPLDADQVAVLGNVTITTVAT